MNPANVSNLIAKHRLWSHIIYRSSYGSQFDYLNKYEISAIRILLWLIRLPLSNYLESFKQTSN